MSRKRFSERQVLETLWHQGIEVRCFRCNHVLGHPMLDIEREHIHEVALGGEDTPYNCRYSHKICHGIATNGTKATTAGSSKHRIAKANRIEREAKFAVIKAEPVINMMDALRGVPPKPKAKFPKGRKLQSRGFEKRVR